MGTGTNRVCSGKGNDAYSLILDKSLDIIYDKGGEIVVAVALPEGVTFYDVWLDILDEEYILYCGREKESATKCLRYIFHGDEDGEARVKSALFFVPLDKWIMNNPDNNTLIDNIAT